MGVRCEGRRVNGNGTQLLDSRAMLSSELMACKDPWKNCADLSVMTENSLSMCHTAKADMAVHRLAEILDASVCLLHMAACSASYFIHL